MSQNEKSNTGTEETKEEIIEVVEEEKTNEAPTNAPPPPDSFAKKTILNLISLQKDIFHNVKEATFSYPIKMIVTFCGIGFLPDWQKHWSSAASFLLMGIILYNTISFSAPVMDMAVILFLYFILLSLIGITCISLYQKKDPEANNEIMINVVLGQMFMISITTPAYLAISKGVISFYSWTCNIVFGCPQWFYSSVIFLSTMAFPYGIYRIYDSIQPWPIGLINLRLNNAFSKYSESMLASIYAAITLYIIAFMFADLTTVEAIQFIEVLIMKSLHVLSSTSISAITDIDLVDMLEFDSITEDFQQFLSSEENISQDKNK